MRVFGIYFSFRRFLVFSYDLAMIGACWIGAFILRLDFQIPAVHLSILKSWFPWIYLIQGIVFWHQGLYRGVWHFASTKDLLNIIRAVLISQVIFLVVVVASSSGFQGFPRSVLLIDAALLVLSLGGGRFAYRIGREWLRARRMPAELRGARKRILILGAGYRGNAIAREYSNRSDLQGKVVGFLDDKQRLFGSQIQGVPVLGPLSLLEKTLAQFKVNELIIAIDGLDGVKVREILSHAQKRSLPVRIAPSSHGLTPGKLAVSELREVKVEDLLRRDVVTVDDSLIRASLKGRTILVTGAGGSIGSELFRQCLRFEPATLVLVERSEFNLYRIQQETLQMQRDFPSLGTSISFVIGDILNEGRMREVLSTYRPEIVLHAAAYKHVPMMEENKTEALLNNVVGTQRLVDQCALAGVEKFVLISTDKAVRPTSVMGATKRMAELITHAVGREKGIATLAVRFGNVLDSEGSVLPLFRDQVARGGPVTVTHPDVTRYFMTIPEASLLVLQASALGEGGEVFLLDMGEPVKIKDLAEEVIKLSGFEPGRDIPIVYTGLRKGEKLYEELFIDLQKSERTSHPKVLVSRREIEDCLPENWRSQIDAFLNDKNLEIRQIQSWIKAWVPEYQTEGHEELWSQTTSAPQQLQ